MAASSMLSCTQTQTTHMNLSSGGRFQVINVDTNDTVSFRGEGLTGSNYSSIMSMQIKVGERIKLDFIPDEEYKAYTHRVAYHANDGMDMVREGKTFDYGYTIPRSAIGNDTIDMLASCTEENVISSSSGKVVLRVTE